MPSPFPGMDPYLEGYLWPDVHHDLAGKIREQLAPQLRPKYVARIEVYVATDDDPLAEVGVMYPDVEVLRSKQSQSPLEAGVHLLEIDLLRRGQRPLPQATIPAGAYRVTLTRVQAHKVEIWPITLSEPLPLLPVPLRSPDADVVLNLGQALQDIYDVAAYELTIDYTAAPPPPPLSEEETAWLEARLREAGVRD